MFSLVSSGVSFQCVNYIKIIDEIFDDPFLYCLQNLLCILHLQHVSIQTRPISSAQEPHVVSCYHIYMKEGGWATGCGVGSDLRAILYTCRMCKKHWGDRMVTKHNSIFIQCLHSTTHYSSQLVGKLPHRHSNTMRSALLLSHFIDKETESQCFCNLPKVPTAFRQW